MALQAHPDCLRLLLVGLHAAIEIANKDDLTAIAQRPVLLYRVLDLQMAQPCAVIFRHRL